ncbi:MAG: peptidoglycan editing factor PgeF [Dysgonamonadaceae bacterium]|jgi:YfiH family protein|nr:peptidoglycan editing factor PgeF [Dysgonamonadaceae bacterium]
MTSHAEYQNLLQFGIFRDEQEIEHFSTTRAGGVSKGEFSSLNLGNFSDDDPLCIVENRQILARMFCQSVSDFVIPHQTHGSKILLIDQSFLSLNIADKTEALYGVDACLTREKDLFLCVTTADCVPVILFDKSKKVIASIHAGWRGTVARIVEKTIGEMRRIYDSSPKDIVAGIGPAICLKNFEVGDEVVAEFKRNDFDLTDEKVSSCSTLTGKTHLNLPEINRRELLRLGVPESQIETAEYCTFDHPDLFFSARRQSVHSGRMLTGIKIKTKQKAE